MKIKRLYAENFRNIESCDITFSPGVNLFIGNNAEGKTNAVEAIYLFSRGKSHRTSDERDMVRFGTEGFRLKIEYESTDGDETLEYAAFGRERVRRKNGYRISRVSEMIGSFRSVLFYPDNLEIVKDGPDERRSFLNIAISQVYPSYVSIYTKYKEALDARNKLLKMSREHYIDRREIDAWSLSVAEYASYVYLMRVEYLKKLDVYTKDIAMRLSGGKDEITLGYKSDITDSEAIHTTSHTVDGIPTDIDREAVKREYYKKLTENLDRELAVGSSLYGPQRDDIEISINGSSARGFASPGQKRSIVLSLKLAEGEVIREIYGEYPVFLFDDVLSELDENRKKYIVNGIKKRQIIISSCEKDDGGLVPDKVIEVFSGEYKER